MSYNIHIIEKLEMQVAQLKETVSLQALEITELTQQYQDEVKALVVMMGERDKIQQELDLERQKRCGNCADSRRPMQTVASHTFVCISETSACGGSWRTWPADHGCPHHRTKEGK